MIISYVGFMINPGGDLGGNKIGIYYCLEKSLASDMILLHIMEISRGLTSV